MLNLAGVSKNNWKSSLVEMTLQQLPSIISNKELTKDEVIDLLDFFISNDK